MSSRGRTSCPVAITAQPSSAMALITPATSSWFFGANPARGSSARRHRGPRTQARAAPALLSSPLDISQDSFSRSPPTSRASGTSVFASAGNRERRALKCQASVRRPGSECRSGRKKRPLRERRARLGLPEGHAYGVGNEETVHPHQAGAPKELSNRSSRLGPVIHWVNPRQTPQKDRCPTGAPRAQSRPKTVSGLPTSGLTPG
jgi:hypothetical protein